MAAQRRCGTPRACPPSAVRSRLLPRPHGGNGQLQGVGVDAHAPLRGGIYRAREVLAQQLQLFRIGAEVGKKMGRSYSH